MSHVTFVTLVTHVLVFLDSLPISPWWFRYLSTCLSLYTAHPTCPAHVLQFGCQTSELFGASQGQFPPPCPAHCLLTILDFSFRPRPSQQCLPVFLVFLLLPLVVCTSECSTRNFSLIFAFTCQCSAHLDCVKFAHLRLCLLQLNLHSSKLDVVRHGVNIVGAALPPSSESV